VPRSCQALRVSIISVSLPHWYFFSLHSNSRGLVVSNYSGRRFFKCSSSYLRRMERFVAVKYEVAWEVCRDRVWVVAACRVVQPIVLCVGVSLVCYLFMILVLPRWYLSTSVFLRRSFVSRRWVCLSVGVSLGGRVSRWVSLGGCVSRWVCFSVDVFLGGCVSRWVYLSVDVSFSGCISRCVCS
jgi:hypothetical protein